MKKLTLFTILLLLSMVLLNAFVFKKVPDNEFDKIISEASLYQHPIKSIEMTEPNNHDLAFLDTVLKDNRIVFLGESLHLDGQTLKAKARLIKYLHENLGYNVVLYEAGQYDMWMVNQEMENRSYGINKDSIAGLGMFNYWWGNEETNPLNNYYLQSKKTKNPITLGGFDIQFSGDLLTEINNKGYLRRIKLLREFLANQNISLYDYPFINQNIDNLTIFRYKNFIVAKFKQKVIAQLLKELETISLRILKLPQTEESIIYARYLKDIKNEIQKNLNYKSGTNQSMQFRDSLMAENLIYQLDSLYPNQKVIIWSANVHAFKKYYPKTFKPLGKYIHDRYKNQVYSIGFTSYGEFNPLKQIFKTPNKFAVENAYHQLKKPYFFLNFRQIPNQSVLKSEYYSVIDQAINTKAKWSDFVDGIFYIDVNQVSTPLNEEK
jgi:erythromycin esterase